MTPTGQPAFKACVFDVYGTLLDFNSAVARCADEIGPDADRLSALWRQKQLEYSWLRSLMGRHAEFSQVTADALDHSLAAFGIDKPGLRNRLLALYDALAPYPEAATILQTLRDAEVKTAVLSNGDPRMLKAGLDASGLTPLLDDIYSVEVAGIFKPHPSVYQIAVDGLDAAPQEIAFLSANGWDIAGAANFGFHAIWVNRAGATIEHLPTRPASQIDDLSGLPKILGLSA